MLLLSCSVDQSLNSVELPQPQPNLLLLLNQQLRKLMKYQEAPHLLITSSTAQISMRDIPSAMEEISLSHTQNPDSTATQPGPLFKLKDLQLDLSTAQIDQKDKLSEMELSFQSPGQLPVLTATQISTQLKPDSHGHMPSPKNHGQLKVPTAPQMPTQLQPDSHGHITSLKKRNHG